LIENSIEHQIYTETFLPPEKYVKESLKPLPLVKIPRDSPVGELLVGQKPLIPPPISTSFETLLETYVEAEAEMTNRVEEEKKGKKEIEEEGMVTAEAMGPERLANVKVGGPAEEVEEKLMGNEGKG